MPLIILLLRLLNCVSLILETLAASAVVILNIGRAHVAVRTASNSGQGRARRHARDHGRLQHPTSMRSIFCSALVSERRIRRVQSLQLMHSRELCPSRLRPASRRPLTHRDLLLLLLLLALHEVDLISFHSE